MIMVSVIIPVYNAEKYIEECLDSVLNQTMNQLEIICIDDGSTDDSLQILQNYQRADSRMKLYSQKNQGAGPARNRGLKEAEGKYVAFVDADDFWHDDFALEKIVRAAEVHQSIVTGAFWGNYKDGRYTRSPFHGKYFENGSDGEQIDFQDEQSGFHYWSYLFRRDYLIHNNLFFPPYYRFQDPPFLVRILEKVRSYFVIPVDWYCYRMVYKAVLSTQEKTVDFLKGVIDVLNIAQKHNFHTLSSEMFAEVNAHTPSIIKGILHGNKELPVLMERINAFAAAGGTELEAEIFIRESVYKQCKAAADRFWQRIKPVEKIIIYGAGYCGNLILRQIEKNDVESEIVFAETEPPKERKVCGRECLWIDELAENKEKAIVIIAVLTQTQPALVANMKRLGFENYICLDMELMTALECMG